MPGKHKREWQSPAERFHVGITEKECNICGLVLPISKFKSRGKCGERSGQSTYHAACNRCLYIKYQRPSADKKRDAIHAYQLEKGCADCGYKEHVAALDFDHLPEKEKLFNIGEQMGNYSLKKLWAEVAKCDVVCANCHRIRTHDRRKLI